MDTRSRQSTEGSFDRTVTTVLQAGGVTSKVDAIRTGVIEEAKAAMNAAKLVLAEAGVMRVLIQQRGTVKMGNQTDPEIIKQIDSGRKSYEATTGYKSVEDNVALLDGRDTPYFDSVFACGDYWMPLSISFSVSSRKVLDNSQLVDGPNITQRVTKSPKMVNVSFSIERKELPQEEQNADYIEATSIRFSEDSTTDKQAIYKMTRMLQDLYENNDVFQVQNPVLNDEIGISWAVMTDYRFSPSEGSTFARVSFTLQEVNVNDPLLYQTDISDDSKGIPTEKK